MECMLRNSTAVTNVLWNGVGFRRGQTVAIQIHLWIVFPRQQLSWGGGTPMPRPFPFTFRFLFIVAKLLRRVQRVFPRPSAGSNADCALRKPVCPRGRFPKVRRLRDGPPSQLRQPRPRTRPFAGVRDVAVSPTRKDAWRRGIESPLPLCENLLGKFLVAVHWVCPASLR